MQNLENNNWIILDPLGHIYEIYANLAAMTTLLNLNHFWKTQAEFCLKGTFIKASVFHVCYNLFRYLWKHHKKKL